MKPLKEALTGKQAPAKEKSNYVGDSVETPRRAKKQEKKVTKPKSKKRTIKSSYSPDMEPDTVEKQVGTYSDKPIVNDAPEVTNPDYINALNQGAQEMSNAEKDAPNLWTGLAPLAMGAIMGDIGVGAGIGGQLMLDEGLANRKDRRSRETASMKMENANQPSRGTFQWKNYEKPDGTIGLMKVNTATGEEMDTDKTAGFSHAVSVSPVTGELVRTSKGSNTSSRAINPHSGTNVKQQKYQADFRKTLLSDKQFQSYRKSHASSGQALTMLAANNAIGDKAIMTIMPRIMGEVGNLTAAEQQAYSGSPLFTRKLEALRERYARTGGFTEADRADLMEVAQVMQTHSKAKASELLGQYKQSEQSFRGEDYSKAVDPFLQTSSVVPSEVVKRVKAKSPTAGKSPFMAQPNPMRDGYVDVFELSPMGEYKFVRTEKE